MKRYTVINNKTNNKTNYSELVWNAAWWLVFIFGIITGAILF
jgi:hypothetical protein